MPTHYGRVVTAEDLGITPGPSIDNTGPLQDAINRAIADEFDVLQLGPGLYRHNGLTMSYDGDARAGLAIKGFGRRLTTLQCMQDSAVGLRVESPSGNVRDWVISDITFASGASSVSTTRASYGLFQNCTFSFSKQTATIVHAGNNIEFAQCWWVHNQGESGRVTTGSAHITGGIMGEDTGEWIVAGDLTCVGLKVFNSATKLQGTSHSMGRAAFNVQRNLVLTGCRLSSNFNLINMNYPDSVTLSGNRISCSGAVVALRQNQTGACVNMVGNVIKINDGGSLYRRTSTGHLKNSVVAENVIYLEGPAFSATFDDALLDPGHNNRVEGNVIRYGEMA